VGTMKSRMSGVLGLWTMGGMTLLLSSVADAAECRVSVNSSEHGGVAALASALFEQKFQPTLPSDLRRRLSGLDAAGLIRIGEGHRGHSEEAFRPLYLPDGLLNSRVVMRLRAVAEAWRVRLTQSRSSADRSRLRLIERALAQSFPLVAFYNEHPECRQNQQPILTLRRSGAGRQQTEGKTGEQAEGRLQQGAAEEGSRVPEPNSAGSLTE
jgi:hypothetical protein